MLTCTNVCVLKSFAKSYSYAGLNHSLMQLYNPNRISEWFLTALSKSPSEKY